MLSFTLYYVKGERTVVVRETATPSAFVRQPHTQGDLAAAYQGGVHARATLLQAEGGTLTAREVAERLGVVQRVVEERRRAGRLLAFPAPRIRYIYPMWQFGPHEMLPGFEETLAMLTVENPCGRAAFFLAKNAYLHDASPLAELRCGHVADVKRAAQAYGEHGAS